MKYVSINEKVYIHCGTASSTAAIYIGKSFSSILFDDQFSPIDLDNKGSKASYWQLQKLSVEEETSTQDSTYFFFETEYSAEFVEEETVIDEEVSPSDGEEHPTI